MDKLAQRTLSNLSDFALQQYNRVLEAAPELIEELSPEQEFQLLVKALELFLRVAEDPNSYIEDMEDHLACALSSMLSISIKCKMFTEKIDGDELV